MGKRYCQLNEFLCIQYQGELYEFTLKYVSSILSCGVEMSMNV